MSYPDLSNRAQITRICTKKADMRPKRGWRLVSGEKHPKNAVSAGPSGHLEFDGVRSGVPVARGNGSVCRVCLSYLNSKHSQLTTVCDPCRDASASVGSCGSYRSACMMHGSRWVVPAATHEGSVSMAHIVTSGARVSAMSLTFSSTSAGHYRHTDSQAHIQTHIHSCTHAYIHTHVRLLIRLHTLMHMHIHVNYRCTCSNLYIRMCGRIYT